MTIKIAITGALGSGKSTVAKIISNRKIPIFYSDKEVAKVYNVKAIRKKIINKLKLNSVFNLKYQVKKRIIENYKNIFLIEKIIHPHVRKALTKFISKNKKKKMILLEIPLLFESKLQKKFDITILVRSKKNLRIARCKKNKIPIKILRRFDSRLIPDKKKAKLSDYIIVNNKNLRFLKSKITNIILR